MASFTGGTGNDIFTATTAADFFDGGTGFDTVNEFVTGRRAGSFTVQANGDVTFTDGAQVDTFRGIEQIDFADGRVAFGLGDPAVAVVRLYNAALDRSPDQGGLNFYVFSLQTGGSLTGLAENFLASPEFQGRFGANLSNEQYIDRLYENVLDRDPSASETQFYVDAINGGTSRAQLLVSFSESPENQGKTAGLVRAGVWDVSENAATVARIYDTMFDRVPDLGGLRSYRQQLDAGENTPLGIVQGFILSPEFGNRYGNAVTTADFVRLLYTNTLNRQASQSEIDYYVTRIDGDQLTLSEAVLGFAESPEHMALTAPSIMSENPAQFGISFT